jgi:hypothetical protein
MQHVIHYFNSHPESGKCHVTSDGFIFHQEHDAQAHAHTLSEKKVRTITRDESENFLAEDAPATGEADPISKEVVAKLVEAVNAVEALDDLKDEAKVEKVEKKKGK